MKRFIPILLSLGVAQAPLRAQSPTITNPPASRAVWVGCNVAFAVGASGPGSFTYQWQLNHTNLPDGIITAIAGNGTFPSSGDGGPATNAGFSGIMGVALNASGDVFIADQEGNRVREVTANGIVHTAAGNGTNSNIYSGNGGPATNANVGFPLGVTVDSSGNVFIVAELGQCVSELNTNGISTFVAGDSFGTFSGDGGPATNAGLAFPYGVAVDTADNLFIADTFNNRIREVDTNGIITTVACSGPGDTIGGYSGDGGQATNALLNQPSGAAVDAFGNLFIADRGNNRIRKVDTNGIITTVAGTGAQGFSGDGSAATTATFNSLFGVTVDDSGNLFIADSGNNRIRKVDTNGIIATVAGNGQPEYSGDGGAATNAGLNPMGVAADAFGDLFLAAGNIRKVTNTQGPTLALNNATPGNAGAYQVVVTSPGGSVTSSVAQLTVATAPLIYGTAVNRDGSVTLSCVSQPGSTNVLLGATNLLAPVIWRPLSTNIAGPDGDWQYTDASAGSYPARFYQSVKP